MDEDPQIVRHPGVWGGKAVVDGTRIPVFILAARFQSGWTEAKVLDTYPSLTSEDVQAVIRYAESFPERVTADEEEYERSLPPV